MNRWVAIALCVAPVAAADPIDAGSQRDAVARVHADRQAGAESAQALDGSLDAYVAHALSHSPAVRAAFAR